MGSCATRQYLTVATTMLALGCGGEVVLFGSGDGSEMSAAGGGSTTGAAGGGSTTGATSSAGGAGSTSEASATATGSGASGSGGGGAGGMGQGGEPAPPCHPPGLIDTFDGNAVDLSLWNTQGEDRIISVYGGLLHITPNEGVGDDQWTGMVTTDEYDLTQCSVWIMVPSLVKDGAEGSNYFQLYSDSGQASLTVTNGQLQLKIGDQVTTTPYSMSSQLWWRIRDDGGTLLLETSPDADDWTVVHSAPTPPWIDNVAIGLGTVSPTNATQLGETQWDNLNALP